MRPPLVEQDPYPAFNISGKERIAALVVRTVQGHGRYHRQHAGSTRYWVVGDAVGCDDLVPDQA